MGENVSEKMIRADLQTAQNRMFPFVSEAMLGFEKDKHVEALLNDQVALTALFKQAQQQLFSLLNIPEDQRDTWHMGIADSGKRTIEILVDSLCRGESGKNALLDTENYVGFNKFSAATALEKQKGTTFETPFNVKLGDALTINPGTEFDKLNHLFENNQYETLWIPWNSTSTGVQEDLAQIVKRRQAARSHTLIIADAASKHLFSNEWQHTTPDNLPDIFFFSLRKQGLPYEGPNDEFHQAQNSGALIVFNDKALQQSHRIQGTGLYNSPSLAECAMGQVTSGEQRANHIKHLLKLNCAFNYFLSDGRKPISTLEASRKAAHSKIMATLQSNGSRTPSGFSLISDPDAQSESAYILKVPESTSAKKVISQLKDDGILISMSMHPKLDGQKLVRFAFYPGNSIEEVDHLLQYISRQ